MKEQKRRTENELRPEYKRSDFRKWVRGEYAGRLRESSNVVVIDPDISKRFPNAAPPPAAVRRPETYFPPGHALILEPSTSPSATHMAAIASPRAHLSARILTVEFEWDPNKAVRNLEKHKVSFAEAATVFGDFLGNTVPDPDHSAGEPRFLTVGLSSRNRLLIVSHTERRGRVRIISARELTRNERNAYETTRQKSN